MCRPDSSEWNSTTISGSQVGQCKNSNLKVVCPNRLRIPPSQASAATLKWSMFSVRFDVLKSSPMPVTTSPIPTTHRIALACKERSNRIISRGSYVRVKVSVARGGVWTHRKPPLLTFVAVLPRKEPSPLLPAPADAENCSAAAHRDVLPQSGRGRALLPGRTAQHAQYQHGRRHRDRQRSGAGRHCGSSEKAPPVTTRVPADRIVFAPPACQRWRLSRVFVACKALHAECMGAIQKFTAVRSSLYARL